MTWRPECSGVSRPLLPVVLSVNQDEPCLLLAELNLPTPDNRGRHRYQIAVVVRNDRPAEFRTDMGPETPEEEFRVVGCVETGTGRIDVLHTVAELRDIADNLRERRSGWTRQIEPRDLVQGYHRYVDELSLRRRRVSVSGPLVSVSRN